MPTKRFREFPKKQFVKLETLLAVSGTEGDYWLSSFDNEIGLGLSCVSNSRISKS